MSKSKKNTRNLFLFPSILVLFTCFLVSFHFIANSDFAGDLFKKTHIEQIATDANPEKENVEEKEFSEGDSVASNKQNESAKFNFFTCDNSVLLFPKIALDIPIPPPKITTS